MVFNDNRRRLLLVLFSSAVVAMAAAATSNSKSNNQGKLNRNLNLVKLLDNSEHVAMGTNTTTKVRPASNNTATSAVTMATTVSSTGAAAASTPITTTTSATASKPIASTNEGQFSKKQGASGNLNNTHTVEIKPALLNNKLLLDRLQHNSTKGDQVENNNSNLREQLLERYDVPINLHQELPEDRQRLPPIAMDTMHRPVTMETMHRPLLFVGGAGYVPPPQPPHSNKFTPLYNVHKNTVGYYGGGNNGLNEPHHPGGSGGGRPNVPNFWDEEQFEQTTGMSSTFPRNPVNQTGMNSIRVQHIQAECSSDNYMKIQIKFTKNFYGLIYSAGYSYDNDCIYINGSGQDYYEYLIKLNRCGTLSASNHVEGRKEPSKNFMWNTITVQYNSLIEEEFDEHFKVTCEYGYDFWKTVTFPFLDVEVATSNPLTFTLQPPECYMEILHGFGLKQQLRVMNPVRVGDPLTLLINMRSSYDGFDLIVNNCYAHNGALKRIQLVDEFGCPVDSKLISPFRGQWQRNKETNAYETQIYAYLKTFRFTGSPALYIECDVRMCHGQCPSQPCYWRNIKDNSNNNISRRRRRKRTLQTLAISNSSNAQLPILSEKMNLYQSLKVLLNEEEDVDFNKHNKISSPISNFRAIENLNNEICVKTISATILIGFTTLTILILTILITVYYQKFKYYYKSNSNCNVTTTIDGRPTIIDERFIFEDKKKKKLGEKHNLIQLNNYL